MSVCIHENYHCNECEVILYNKEMENVKKRINNVRENHGRHKKSGHDLIHLRTGMLDDVFDYIGMSEKRLEGVKNESTKFI